MTDLIITPIAAEAANGNDFPAAGLASLMRNVGQDRWPGRDAALAEIAAGDVVDDANEIADTPDDTIASYLLLTRCDDSPNLPDLGCVEAKLVPAADIEE